MKPALFSISPWNRNLKIESKWQDRAISIFLVDDQKNWLVNTKLQMGLHGDHLQLCINETAVIMAIQNFLFKSELLKRISKKDGYEINRTKNVRGLRVCMLSTNH